MTHSIKYLCKIKGCIISQKAKEEYLREIKPRYKRADKLEKQKIIDEFCQTCCYNRKSAIRLLNGKETAVRSKKKKKKPIGRSKRYNDPVIIYFLKVFLMEQVPVKTNQWGETISGFIEADLVTQTAKVAL